MAVILRVSSKTRPAKLGAAILHALKKSYGVVEVQAIGAGAVNQGIKGIAVASNLAQADGKKLLTVPYFATTRVDGSQRTAIRFRISSISRDFSCQ